MTALARVIMLTMLILLRGLGKPEVIVPLLALMPASLAAVSPFFISDQERLDTLYAVLPLTRRSLLLGRYVWALATFAAGCAILFCASAAVALALNPRRAPPGRSVTSAAGQGKPHTFGITGSAFDSDLDRPAGNTDVMATEDTARLRESGMTVYGFGERKTPKPFVAACDKSHVRVSRIESAGQGSAIGV